jgi:tetratricopeptide (TPR) repeat protein
MTTATSAAAATPSSARSRSTPKTRCRAPTIPSFWSTTTSSTQAEALADQAWRSIQRSTSRCSPRGVHIQRGDLPAAREDFLDAVAANPLMAQSTLGLAIQQYEAGDLAQAYQSIEAAERLDPNDPIAPLVRTVIALDRAEIDDAIINARKAFRALSCARAASTIPFAATQSAGSYMTGGVRHAEL